MNETERLITSHLQRLADDAPDADLATVGRAGAPAHRSWTTPALVAAALVVLVAVGALVVPRGGGDHEPVVAGPTPSPAAPPGQRLVGRGGLVVSVPAEWPIDVVSCGSQERGDLVVVSGSGATRSCLRVPTAGSVEVAVGPVSDVTTPGETELMVGRYRVTESEGRSPTGNGISLALRSPDAEASFVISGPAARVRAVASTLRAVPDGYAVVPDPDQSAPTATRSTVRRQFDAAGFAVAFRSPSDDPPAGLEGLVDPPPGTLARTGSTITLTID